MSPPLARSFYPGPSIRMVADVFPGIFGHRPKNPLNTSGDGRPDRALSSVLLEYLPQGLHHEAQVVVGEVEGRADRDDVVETWRGVAVFADDEPALLAAGDDRAHPPGARRLPALLVLDDLDAVQEALPPDLPDVREVFEPGERSAELLAHLGGPFDQPLFLEDLEVSDGDGACRGVAAECVDVAEAAVLFRAPELLEELALDGGRRQGHVGARYHLRHRDDVGLYAVVLVAEPLAGAAEAADHLVHDEHDAGPLADGGDLLDVALRRYDDAAASDDGLHDDAGDGFCELPAYNPLYLGGVL